MPLDQWRNRSSIDFHSSRRFRKKKTSTSIISPRITWSSATSRQKSASRPPLSMMQLTISQLLWLKSSQNWHSTGISCTMSRKTKMIKMVNLTCSAHLSRSQLQSDKRSQISLTKRASFLRPCITTCKPRKLTIVVIKRPTGNLRRSSPDSPHQMLPTKNKMVAAALRIRIKSKSSKSTSRTIRSGTTS